MKGLILVSKDGQIYGWTPESNKDVYKELQTDWHVPENIQKMLSNLEIHVTNLCAVSFFRSLSNLLGFMSLMAYLVCGCGGLSRKNSIKSGELLYSFIQGVL